MRESKRQSRISRLDRRQVDADLVHRVSFVAAVEGGAMLGDNEVVLQKTHLSILLAGFQGFDNLVCLIKKEPTKRNAYVLLRFSENHLV